MDTRESQTPEEELQRLKEINEPEDFEHPEPDETQPEARDPARGLSWLLPLAIVLAVAVLGYLLVVGMSG
ncbi:hypothetical protein IOC61_16685 [Halomonas sp. KAO]|uniref:hypothetical protein n=1 Tax=unclassified Halomonas TaxID=2609666 RepID=UPI00189D9D9D|nr:MULTISPECIES: hypothetical protein [unclassified Halomonas]MBF7054937.1 hypothetical protein [Halomonas sp. KAO]MDT0501466.1 hypothetical protein [Halomonas sp. PAR7]MDT0512852.1 hypothetical protein [Halomonas sp. LES1]MDT0591323.1 hypothetical protein [Halomonas sp. PAR8]